MRKGTGMAAGFGLIGLLISMGVYMAMQKKSVEEVTPQMANQLAGLNAMTVEALNGSLEAYLRAKGASPERLEELVPEYLDQVPREAFSRLSATVAAYDGTGGWVYAPGSGAVAVNHPQKPNVR